MFTPLKTAFALVAATALALSGGSLARAQMAASTPGHAYPSIAGEKVRGLEELNNSGQVGSVSLTAQPDKTTHVILTVKGAGGKTESAGLYRSNDLTCKNISEKPEFALSPVAGGKSSTMVKIDRERLLSGNYLVVVKDGAKHVACAHLVDE
jgi:hypothetical protein